MAWTLVLAALTACGSTAQVPLGGGPVADGAAAPGGDGLSVGSQQSASPDGSQPLSAGASGTSTSASTGSDTGPSAGSSRPGTSGGAVSGRGPAGTAPGVTPTTIKIGIYTVAAYSSVVAQAGFSVATGDQAAQANGVIKYLNQRGGIAGRQIVPVFHDFNVGAASTDYNSEYQGACAAWTQDDRVYAVTTPVGTLSDNMYACLAKAGVISSATGDHKDARFYRKYHDFFYMPTEINMTRMLADNVHALFDAGWFGTTPKIGIVRLDVDQEKFAVDDGLKPALASHGLAITEEFAAPYRDTQSYSNAVLNFKSKGITHVLFSVLGSTVSFMQNAETQQYRPRYGLTSRHSPASVLQSNVPASQLRGSKGIGWQPMNDTDPQKDPGPSSERTKVCLKILQEAGQDTSVRSIAQVGLWICDSLFFLRDALARSPNLTPAGFRTGAESLSHYEAASTFRSSFAPGRLHDGAKRYRLFAFDDACECYGYVTGQRDLP